MSQGIFTPSLVSMGSAGRAPDHVTALTQTQRQTDRQTDTQTHRQTETETVLYLLEKWQLITVSAVHEEDWVCGLWGGGGGARSARCIAQLCSPVVYPSGIAQLCSPVVWPRE